jgi:superfamily II DNA or RNA helicase
MAPTRLSPAPQVAATIGQLLATPHRPPTQLGQITLAPHQRDAVTRLLTLLQRYAGALLADDVGLGKTFVALGVAQHYQRPVIIAPAALRPHWRAATQRTGQQLPILSLQQLSNTPHNTTRQPDLVVIDEAHHLRNPATKRYAHVAQLCANAHTLLVSATPIHNSRNDLEHLFALFLAPTTKPHTAQQLIVRRTSIAATAPHTPSARPRVSAMRDLPAIPSDHTSTITQQIAALPLPTTHAATTLVHLGLLRHWTSSASALLTALRTLRTRLSAIDHALAIGAPTDPRTIARQLAGPDTLQLDLLATLEQPDTHTHHARPIDREAVQRAAAAVEALRRHVATLAPAHDTARTHQLLALRDLHAPAPIIAFSQFASTIRAFGRLLQHTPGIATICGQHARIASGPISRTTLLQLLAPRAHHTTPPPPRLHLSLLLTTDALSEGLDLSDAVAVVHLDLPWTDTRLAQRLGRIARLGSPHTTVAQYRCQSAIPASLEQHALAQLTRKRQLAEAVMGPSAFPTTPPTPLAHTTTPPLGRITAATRESARETLQHIALRWATRTHATTQDATAQHATATTNSSRNAESDGNTRRNADASTHTHTHTRSGTALVPLPVGARAVAIGIVRTSAAPQLVVACAARMPTGVRVGASPQLLCSVARQLDAHLDDPPHHAEEWQPAARRARRAMQRWADMQQVEAMGLRRGMDTLGGARGRDAAVIARAGHHIEQALTLLPAADRITLLPLARQAQRAVARLRGADQLQRIATLVAHPPAARSATALHAWLTSCIALAPAAVAGPPSAPPVPLAPRVRLLLLGLPVRHG